MQGEIESIILYRQREAAETKRRKITLLKIVSQLNENRILLNENRILLNENRLYLFDFFSIIMVKQ